MVNKKILIFEAYNFFSGAQRVSLNFCKVLKSEGYHLTLLLADDSEGIHQKKFGAIVDEVIVMNTSEKLTTYGNAERWFKIGNFFSSIFTGLFPFYIQCFKIFKKHKFDGFYYCDPRGAVMMAPLIFFKGKKICYLQGKNKLNKYLARLIFFSYSDKILCPSTDVLNSLPKSDKKMVVNYGIDFSQYTNIDSLSVKNEILTLTSKDDNNARVKLLYGGLIRPQKGVHHIMNALKEIKEQIDEKEMPVIFILGQPNNEAEENFKSYLVNFSKTNNLDKYIYWMGWKDNMLQWMKSCDFFIFPTIDREYCDFEGFDKVIESSEGSPVVLIESSLCGLFTLAAKVTGVNETISDMHNGLMYDPNQANELSEKLLYLLKEKPRFVDFPNKDRFSAEKFAEKVADLFKDL